MKKIAVVFLLLHSHLYALGEPEKLLFAKVIKALVAVNLPTTTDQDSVDLDQVQQQITQLSNLLTKISEDPKTLGQILAVRDGFYTSDGQVFRAILLAAAKDKTERDAFIEGLKYEKCKKWFWECGLPPVSWDKIKFKFFSKLKSDIDALEQSIQRLGNIPDDATSDFDPRTLDPYESYFQLFAELEPDLGDLLSFLLKFYTGQSLQTLNQDELKELLKKQISFLNDKENGAIGFIRKSRPRI